MLNRVVLIFSDTESLVDFVEYLEISGEIFGNRSGADRQTTVERLTEEFHRSYQPSELLRQAEPAQCHRAAPER